METREPIITMDNVIGVDYEVFQECVNNEIGYHFGQLYSLGENTTQGQAHLKAIDLLEKLRKEIKPDDIVTMEAVFLTLEATKIGREDNIPEAMSA